MVAILVVLTIVALVALDYFVLRKKRRAAATEEIVLPGLQPLSEAIDRLPTGVFLQPTYTWSRIREDGQLMLGVHPLLLGLVGAPYQLELLTSGERVDKGAPLIRIKRGGRGLTVRSPVAGRITAVNHVLCGETEWRGMNGDDGCWLYRIEPENVASEIAGWMIADRAVQWTRTQYARLREYLSGVVGTTELGVTMADGGEIPVGILANLDEAGWEAFQDTFLSE
jgi:glycine cleavage system H lipoate-binding protein